MGEGRLSYGIAVLFAQVRLGLYSSVSLAIAEQCEESLGGLQHSAPCLECDATYARTAVTCCLQVEVVGCGPFCSSLSDQ